MINQIIAEKFEEIAAMLEILDESPFRIRAYERAADVVRGFSQDLGELHATNDAAIEEIPGIGKDLHMKIVEIVTTGDCKMHKDLVKKLSPGLLQILKVRGVGPKKAKMFFEDLGVDTIAKLRSALENGAIAALPRMGEKSAQGILEALEQSTHLSERIPLAQALPVAEAYVEYMKKCAGVEQVEYAGSLRRRVETIGDIDILATGKKHENMIEHFCEYPKVKQVLAKGETRAAVVLSEGNIQVDLRVVPEKSFGAALYYFTGSKHHNIQTRTMAIKMNLKINEYGIFKGEKSIAGRTEKELFEALGMDYIPPEIREDQGEVEAALKGKLPHLIEEKDIRGDLHVHSKWSDGLNSIYEMAAKAADLGRDYIAITDHSREPEKIKKQWTEILAAEKRLKKEGKEIKILRGAEIDILKNGDLQLPDDILNELDIALVSVHSAFNLSKKEQTERILKAMQHPKVHVLCHPSGRMLGKREEMEVDMEKIVKAAADLGMILEIDSQPQRLDLNGAHARLCKESGVKVCINSDAHTTDQLAQIRFGIFMARRGWIEKKDVVNALPYSQFLKSLRK